MEAQREAIWTFRVNSRAENRGWNPGPSSQETSKAPAAQFWGDGESRWDHFQNEEKVRFHASLFSSNNFFLMFSSHLRNLLVTNLLLDKEIPKVPPVMLEKLFLEYSRI